MDIFFVLILILSKVYVNNTNILKFFLQKINYDPKGLGRSCTLYIVNKALFTKFFPAQSSSNRFDEYFYDFWHCKNANFLKIRKKVWLFRSSSSIYVSFTLRSVDLITTLAELLLHYYNLGLVTITTLT